MAGRGEVTPLPTLNGRSNGMNMTVRFMVITAAAVLLPLLLSGGTQGVQGAQQDISLEGRIVQLQQRVEEKPRDPDLHFELSKLYEEDVERYYDEALSEFGLAVDNGLEGKSYNILNRSVTKRNNKGVALVKVKKYDEAIEMFESAIEKDPNNNHSYHNLAVVYILKEDYDEALKYMKKAIDLNPLDVQFYISLGMAHLGKDDFELALLNLRKIEYIDPKFKGHYFVMGQVYRGLGEYAKAIEALNKLPRDYQEYEKIKAFREECQRLQKQSR